MPILNTLRHAPSAPSVNKRVHLSAHVLCTPYFYLCKKCLHSALFAFSTLIINHLGSVYTSTLRLHWHLHAPWFLCHYLRSNTLLAHPFIRSQTETRTGIGGEILQTEQESFLTPVTVFSPSHNNVYDHSVSISPCLHKGSHQSADSADECRQVQIVSTRLII